uniref:Uncharacterized protein n=1 Tax=Glossina brevipalpis TaxID=37001 RepID=A0A1A9WFX3_9MUSC
MYLFLGFTENIYMRLFGKRAVAVQGTHYMETGLWESCRNTPTPIVLHDLSFNESLCESWEECRLKDWDDNQLKELLEEAYHYKNPRDKENKSKAFLKLLEKAENEETSYPFCAITPRNLSTSITSNSYYNYNQQNAHHHHLHSSHNSQHQQHRSHHHHHHHHHHHKQGGSLQDLFNETQLDCDQTFGNSSVSGSQRTRRQNHNSRQKKYSSSVSSRQREGGSLPSNVNVTHQLGLCGNLTTNELGFMHDVAAAVATTTLKSSKKEQRRNAKAAAAAASVTPMEANKEMATATTPLLSTNNSNNNNNNNSNITEVLTLSNGGDNNNASIASTSASILAITSAGDCVIEMGEPMMDIQQQHRILQSKGQDAATQGLPYYERLASIDKRIPRANIIGPKIGCNMAPTLSHCYVDEKIHFSNLECYDANTANNDSSTSVAAVDTKYVPLDENYKSCKSILGNDPLKSKDMLHKSKSITRLLKELFGKNRVLDLKTAKVNDPKKVSQQVDRITSA